MTKLFFNKFSFKIIILLLTLSFSSSNAAEGVSIVCPCSVDKVNDTKVDVAFSISLQTFNTLTSNMKVRIVGRDKQGSTNYLILGEATLEGLNYSTEVIPIDMEIPLYAFPEKTIFIDLMLVKSNDKILDFVHLTESPVNYQNNGYYDFAASPSSTPPIIRDSNINFSFTDSLFSLNIPKISSNVLKATSDDISVRLYAAEGLSYYEKANFNYTLDYDANGMASLNIEAQLDTALDSHLWHAPSYNDIYLEFWKDEVRLMKELLVNLSGELVSSRQITLNNIDTLLDSDLDGVSDFNERLIETNPQVSSSFSSREVEIGFSSGTVVGDKYIKTQIDEKISDYIDITNEVFQNSGLNLKVTSVGHAILGDDSNYNLTDLMQRNGIFINLDEKFLRKPDLIVHLTTNEELGFDVRGQAVSQGSMSDGVIPFVISYDQGKNVAMVDVSAPLLVFTHELGHLFGLGHSKREDNNFSGSFLWSNGHGIDNEFVTIMSYDHSYINAPRLGFFSTPNIQCGLNDYPCGVGSENLWNGADNLLTLKTTMIQVGAISNGFGPNIDLANSEPMVLQNIDQLENIIVSANDPEDGDLSQYVTKTLSRAASSEYDYESIFFVTDSDGNRTEQSLKIVVDEIPSTNNWDFDKDGNVDALTDGLLLLRHSFGLRGLSLTDKAISKSSQLVSENVQSNVANASTSFADIDGSGNVDALTDGLILLRYLFGLNGEPLIDSAVSETATRRSLEEIVDYIDLYMP